MHEMHPIVDVSPFEGLPKHKVARLLARFYYMSRLEEGGGRQQLAAIEAKLRAGEDPSSGDIAFRLNKVSGACLQAGAFLLGRTIRSFRQEPATFVTLENFEVLHQLLDRTAQELRALGFLGPPPIETRNAPLLDMAPYEGLPRRATLDLVAAFYTSDAPVGCRAKLNDLEAMIRAGMPCGHRTHAAVLHASRRGGGSRVWLLRGRADWYRVSRSRGRRPQGTRGHAIFAVPARGLRAAGGRDPAEQGGASLLRCARHPFYDPLGRRDAPRGNSCAGPPTKSKTITARLVPS